MRASIEILMMKELGLEDILPELAAEEASIKKVYEKREVTFFFVTLMMLIYTHRHLK